MAEREYRDLAELGLIFVSPGDDLFAELVWQIEQQPRPVGFPPMDDGDNGVVLLNQSGKAVVALAYVWRYTMRDGKVHTRRYSNLHSNLQMEILNGRAKVGQDLMTCILPGSKRLLSERGLFGNNLDVLPADMRFPRGFSGRGGGGGVSFSGGRGSYDAGDVVRTELVLDLAIFDDGIVAGPDEQGLLESLTGSLRTQQAAAEKAAGALRDGASEGAVFEGLLPLARQRPGRAPTMEPPFLMMFTRMAIDQLINGSRAEQLEWFERMAQPAELELRRIG